MTKYICVTCGKGGVGKTTTAVNLASAMHKQGADIILVEANISTPNVHVHLGQREISKCLHDAIKQKVHPAEVVYTHESGLRLIPAMTDVDHLRYPDYEGMKDAMMDLHGHADIMIIDSAPGFGRESLVPMEIADEILIVTTPDHGALEDAKRSVEIAREIKKPVTGIILNMVRRDRHDHSHREVEEELGVPIIATIPFDDKVRSSWRKKHPVVHCHPKSRASKQFYKLATEILGPSYVEGIKRKEDSGVEGYMYKQLGV